jgi:hypothetical protein
MCAVFALLRPDIVGKQKSQVHHYFENALHENAPKRNFNNKKQKT